jgi:hypothetical protein
VDVVAVVVDVVDDVVVTVFVRCSEHGWLFVSGGVVVCWGRSGL